MPGLSENIEVTELTVFPLFWATLRIKKRSKRKAGEWFELLMIDNCSQSYTLFFVGKPYLKDR
jgi:hypothetical protein